MPLDRGIAIVQLISMHAGTVPMHLLRACVLLEKNRTPYSLYDFEQSPEGDIGAAAEKLFGRIKEETVVVSLSCHHNYPKVTHLIFLFLSLAHLKGKKVFVCSPYLFFYDLSLLRKQGVFFEEAEIDAFLLKYLKVKSVSEGKFYGYLPRLLEKHRFKGNQLWTYLSFGCSFHCTFCFNKFLRKSDRGVRQGDLKKIMECMTAAESLSCPEFKFADPNFLIDRRSVSRFLCRYKKEGHRIPWRCKTRLDLIDASIYNEMTDAGCRKIFFGVEHISPAVLESIKKGENTAGQLSKFLSYWDQRADIDLSFLVGLEGEKASDIDKNLSYIEHLSRIQGIQPYLGYCILFNEKRRLGTQVNYLIPLIFLFNFIPEDKSVSPDLLRRLLRLVHTQSFFNFFYLTESPDSLMTVRKIAQFFIRHKDLVRVMPEFHRFMAYEKGAYLDILLESKTLSGLNRAILDKAFDK